MKKQLINASPINYDALNKGLDLIINKYPLQLDANNLKFMASVDYDKNQKVNKDGLCIVSLRDYSKSENKNKISYTKKNIGDFFEIMIIKEFVEKQKIWSINQNGKIERNNLLNEFKKYCYENHIDWKLKNDQTIEMVKDRYYAISKIKGLTNLTKKEFFNSLIPNKFKYNW